MPPSEKMNLIELSLLFTTKGTLVKYAEKNEFTVWDLFYG